MNMDVNFTHGVEHRLYNFKRLVEEHIQVFSYYCEGNLDISSIPEILDLNLEPAEPEYTSFIYDGSADELRVDIKFITQDSKGREISFAINNIKACEMKGCGRSFIIPKKRSTCYFKLFIMDEVTGRQIKEDTVFLQEVLESRAAVEMADHSAASPSSYLGRMLNWVTRRL